MYIDLLTYVINMYTFYVLIVNVAIEIVLDVEFLYDLNAGIEQ